MNVYGSTSLHEFLGDRVVYRSLNSVDDRLPGLQDLRGKAGIEAHQTPRKGQPAYARVIVPLLEAARRLQRRNGILKRLLYVGDTRRNDGRAFRTIARTGGWPGVAFIGGENQEPPSFQLLENEEENQVLYLANRWAALHDLDAFCRDRNFPLDQETAVILDLDKTCLGARGRNDQIINQARVEAVRLTVDSLLGEAFDRDRFQETYQLWNQPVFHAFTGDNQDYLAYICLMLGSDVFDTETVVQAVEEGEMKTFQQFIRQVDEQEDRLSTGLREVHNRLYERVRAHDPTPFKAFRRREYTSTVSRMGILDDSASPEEMLGGEIVITSEVREAALRWRGRGALLFGLSDKPDEASLPPEDLSARGFKPIHRVETHIVGE